MSGAQKTTFQQRFAATDFTDAEAANALATPGEIVSLRAQNDVGIRIILKLASATEEIGPLVLNRLSAETLKNYLITHGF
jgi:hypothetical protein